jgi:hypothetical protein
MRVQLLYFDGCPHWTLMEERLGEALTLSGIPQTIEHCLVKTPEGADEDRFAGSPSILLNGRDPFPAPTSEFGLTCRVYSTPDGFAGAPTVEQLVAAIRGAGKVSQRNPDASSGSHPIGTCRGGRENDPDIRLPAVLRPSPGTRLPTSIQPRDLRPYRVPPAWPTLGWSNDT